MQYSKALQLFLSVLAALLIWFILTVIASFTEAFPALHRVLVLLGGSYKGYIQAIIFIFFFYGIIELYSHHQFIKKQSEGFRLDLLPITEQLVLSPQEVAKIKLKALRFEQQGYHFLLGDFVKKACTQYRNNESIGETLQVFEAHIDNSKAELEGQLEMTNYIVNAIMSIGFIGTLIGLSNAIGMAHLAKTEEGMPQITGYLNVAFDTTLVALFLGLILNFFYHRYLEDLDTFYSQSKSYIIENLISRIYKSN